MKKLSSIFAMLALAGATLFVGCQKNVPTTSTSTTKLVSLTKIDNDLRQINAKYTHNLNNVGAKTTAKNGAAWAAGGADLAAGVAAASETWWMCATGFGGFACGLITTAAAASASYAVYNSMAAGDTTGMQHQKNVIVADVDGYAIPNPYGNPYDSCGIQHNDWVKILCEKTTNLPLTHTSLTFASSDLTYDDLTAIADDTAHIAYNTINFITPAHVLDSAHHVTLTPFVNYEFSSDSCLQNIMTVFFEGFSQITDEKCAMSYINDYENYFINTGTCLTDAEIFGLLHGFSIGKYSYAMWYDAYNN